MYHRMVCPPYPGDMFGASCLIFFSLLLGQEDHNVLKLNLCFWTVKSNIWCWFTHERNWSCYFVMLKRIFLSIREGRILMCVFFPICSGLKGTEGQSCRQRCIWWSRFEKKWRWWKEVGMQPLWSGVATCDVYEHACGSHGLGSSLIWMLKQPCCWGEDIFQSWSCSVEVLRTKFSAIGNMKLDNWFLRWSSLNWAK